MAKKISDLTPATQLGDNDSFVFNDVAAGNDKRVTAGSLRADADVVKVATVADLINLEGKRDGQVVELLGYDVPGDGGGDLVYWDSTSTETPNNATIFQVNGVTTGRWKRPEGTYQIIKKAGAKIDGTTDDTTNINLITNVGVPTFLPNGVIYLNSEIVDNDGSYSWQGIRGNGHRSILKLGALSKIQISNRSFGTVNGADKWTSQGLYDIYLDGNQEAQYGVILGTNTDEGETSLSKSNNGMSFRDVIISGIDGPAWQCGFITKLVWNNCFVKGCDYGWFFYTSQNNTASDVWSLISCTTRSNNIAGLVAISDSVNSVSGNVSGLSIQDNKGWGGFFVGKELGNGESIPLDTYTIINAHFEGNGTFGGVTASSVTVKEHGELLEPSHLYVESTIIKCIGSNFFDGFIQVVKNGVLKLDGCHLYPIETDMFGSCDDTSKIILEDVTFTLPSIDTKSTFIYRGDVHIKSGDPNKQYIQSRIQKEATALDGIVNLVNDPSFASGLSGFVASGTNSPILESSEDESYLGYKSLKVKYNSESGDLSSNALRLDGLGDLNSKSYLAVTFYAYADNNVKIQLKNNNSSYGDNIGTPTIDLPSQEWVRIGCLFKNKDNTVTSSNILSIYPQNAGVQTNFSTTDIDTAADEITLASHSLKDNQTVELTTTGTLPAGLSSGTTYYVIVSNLNTIQLSESKNGSAIDITDVGGGTHTLITKPTIHFDGFCVVKTKDANPSPIIPVMNGGIPNYTGQSAVQSGTAIINSGGTAVAVNHKLGYKPQAESILIIPAEDTGSANSWWADTTTPDTFAIRIDSLAGKNVTFNWFIIR